MSLVIYTKPGCPYCEQARNHYTEKGIEFVEHDAQNDRKHQSEMLRISGGSRVVPCIVQDGELVQSGWGDPPRG